MLSGVLKSEIAINVNIAIMRTFVNIRHLAIENADMNAHLKKLETKYDLQFENVFEALRYLMQKDQTPKQRNSIGYKK
jgi:hypothetical protein